MADGRPLTVVTFRDVTDVRVQRRRFTAFASAAANVAYAGSLRGTLDAICAELVETARLAGAQIFLIDDSCTRMRVHGAAPVDRWPPDFAVRLEAARTRGAELVSFAALRSGQPVVVRHRKAQMLADARWAPLHDQLDGFDWDDFVAVPLVVRDDRSVRSTPTADPATSPTTTRSPFSPQWPTRPRSRWRTRACSPRFVARRLWTSGTGWPANCTTQRASGCSR